jgi:uncharacterized protein (DUF1015 family)
VTRFEPFRGLRYHPSDSGGADVSRFLAPPYDVLSDRQRSDLRALDPANSVRLDYPDGKSNPGAYSEARTELDRWIDQGILMTDPVPTFTVYRMIDPESGHTTTGVFGALGLEHPGEGDVLPHEETTAKDKADRLSLIRATEVNTSPIWVLSVASGLGEICNSVAASSPPSSFGTDDGGVRHESWVVSDPETVRRIRSLVESAPVVVADGHHRLETALAYRTERSDADAILALVVELSPSELDVRPIHRIIEASSTVEITEALEKFFDFRPVDSHTTESEQGPVLVVEANGQTNAIVMEPRPAAFPPEIDLDSQRIRIALAGVSGASTLFHHDVETVKEAVASGIASAGILLRPATVAQIRSVADSRTRMPPKTTFFYPKPRTGVVFRPVVSGEESFGRLTDEGSSSS